MSTHTHLKPYSNRTETKQLIWSPNQLTGFYSVETSRLNELFLNTLETMESTAEIAVFICTLRNLLHGLITVKNCFFLRKKSWKSLNHQEVLIKLFQSGFSGQWVRSFENSKRDVILKNEKTFVAIFKYRRLKSSKESTLADAI